MSRITLTPAHDGPPHASPFTMNTRRNAIAQRIDGCPRCGCLHEIMLKPLANPVGEWTHWALCPVLSEPILSKSRETPETLTSQTDNV